MGIAGVSDARPGIGWYFDASEKDDWMGRRRNAVEWKTLSCRTFKDNLTPLQLFALAYNLANFLRRLALPRGVRQWSLTTLREKLVKIGATVIRRSKYVTFQLAKVAGQRTRGWEGA